MQEGKKEGEEDGVSQCLVDYATVLLQEKQYSEAQIEAELRAAGCTPEVIARIREHLAQQQQHGSASDAPPASVAATAASAAEPVSTTTVIDNEASSEQPAAVGFGIPSVLRKLFY